MADTLHATSQPQAAASAQADMQAILDQLRQCQTSLDDLNELVPSDQMTVVVFSGEMDRLLAALYLAIGAASMGTEVTLFFTFWGLSALRKKAVYRHKNLWHRMLAWMLPCGPQKLKTSHMHFAGIGPKLFNHLMKKQNIPELPEMFTIASELNVKMIACSTAMRIMGIEQSELIEGLEIGGVARYMESADQSRVNLFI